MHNESDPLNRTLGDLRRELDQQSRRIGALNDRLARVERRQIAFDVYREKAGQLVADLIDLTWRALRGREF